MGGHLVPSGWYPDPYPSGGTFSNSAGENPNLGAPSRQLRWWDGYQWTTYVAAYPATPTPGLVPGAPTAGPLRKRWSRRRKVAVTATAAVLAVGLANTSTSPPTSPANSRPTTVSAPGATTSRLVSDQPAIDTTVVTAELVNDDNLIVTDLTDTVDTVDDWAGYDTAPALNQFLAPDTVTLDPDPPVADDVDEGSCNDPDTYENSDGLCIQRPLEAPTAPPGASARCSDGTWSFSTHRRGTCSRHGGVAEWL